MNKQAKPIWPKATWQCVMMCWGDKYSSDDINDLVENIIATSSDIPYFCLITDRARVGLHKAVHCVAFPEFFLNPSFTGGGCQAKLAMFEAGVLRDDLWAIYVDLDTVVFKDISKALDFAKSKKSIIMFQSVALPFSALARFIWRISGGWKYARGNSSFVVFHPANCHFIAKRFRELTGKFKNLPVPKPLIADERFISWLAQPNMQALPRHFGVKFPTEFMLPWGWLVFLKTSLFWVERRRRNLTLITFPGLNLKPRDLLSLQNGEVVLGHHGRRLIWSRRGVGSLQQKLIEFYSNK